MLTVQVKLNVEDIIASLGTLNQAERKKLPFALFELQNDGGIHEAIKEAREDVKSGRVHTHEDVMREIKAKYAR